MRESRPYGSVRGARDETRVPTATTSLRRQFFAAPAHGSYWPTATFRCFAEFDRYRGIADSGKRTARQMCSRPGSGFGDQFGDREAAIAKVSCLQLTLSFQRDCLAAQISSSSKGILAPQYIQAENILSEYFASIFLYIFYPNWVSENFL